MSKSKRPRRLGTAKLRDSGNAFDLYDDTEKQHKVNFENYHVMGHDSMILQKELHVQSDILMLLFSRSCACIWTMQLDFACSSKQTSLKNWHQKKRSVRSNSAIVETIAA